MDLLGLKDKIKTELRDISNESHKNGSTDRNPFDLVNYFRLEQYKAIISLILIYADKNNDESLKHPRMDSLVRGTLKPW